MTVPFIKDSKILQLTSIFEDHGFQIRIVGGAVRDFLMGVEPKDIDLCTNATPDEMIALAKTHNIHVIPTGLQHGTVTFVVDNEPYEITTLRVDVSTDGRHAEVEFTRDFEKDAERRDLTINAMSMDMNGTIYDYFNGRSDIENRKIVFVGDAETRIHEDYLRILRYFRFKSRFDASDVPLDMMNVFSKPEVLEGLSKISGERIWSEFKKIISGPHATGVIFDMISCGIVKAIFNNFNNIEYEVFLDEVVYFKYRISQKPIFHKNNNIFIERDLFAIGVIACLFELDQLDSVIERLKMSSFEQKTLRYYAKLFTTYKRFNPAPVSTSNVIQYEISKGVDPYVAAFGLKIAHTYYDLDLFDTNGDLLVADDFVPFTLSGQDLIKRGIKPGKLMGQLIQMGRIFWRDNSCTVSTEDILEHLLPFKTVDNITVVEYNSSFELDKLFELSRDEVNDECHRLTQIKTVCRANYPNAVTCFDAVDYDKMVTLYILFENRNDAIAFKLMVQTV